MRHESRPTPAAGSRPSRRTGRRAQGAPGSPTLRALACVALAALVHAATPAPDATRAGLAPFALIGGPWMTQALHLSVTALLVPLLAGLLNVRDALASFANPIVFLFLGGFALAAAVLRILAYGASIGGIGTLVGSPPNAIAAAQAGLDFAGWLRIGLPMVALLAPLMVGVPWLVLRPPLGGRLEAAVHEPLLWTRERRLTVAIFALTATGWIAGAPLGRALGIGGDVDGVVAIAAVVALVATGVPTWPDVERRTAWGVLLLFGGGLALSHVMGSSGASRFLADGLVALLHDAPAWVLLLGAVAFAVLLTELVSNTASAALLVPIFLGVAGALGLSPLLLAAAIAVAASCAFMLPVATPPNAIVLGTGDVPVGAMMRCGLVLNLVYIAAIVAVASALA